ncbi:MAG TPA: SDR family oxidoreductase [Anaerolineales bacterium]|nr:SDR family oxidoreductase [Anaerolineales bacterium]
MRGKIVIVTGASSGLGEAAARQFGRLGTRLVLTARRLERLKKLAKEIESLGTGSECLPLRADLSKLGDVKRVVEQTRRAWGGVDVLVNNAGYGRLDWLEKLDPAEDIRGQIDINLLALIQMTRQVLPIMMRQRSGTIINMCSVAGLVGMPTYTIYAASKHGVHGFSEALRREVAPWGIHVCCLYPGGAASEFSRHAGIRRKTGVTTPGFMRLTPEQVGRAVVELARRPRPEWVIPWQWQVAIWLNRLWPRLLDSLVVSRFTIPERAEQLSGRRRSRSVTSRPSSAPPGG